MAQDNLAVFCSIATLHNDKVLVNQSALESLM